MSSLQALAIGAGGNIFEAGPQMASERHFGEANDVHRIEKTDRRTTLAHG